MTEWKFLVGKCLEIFLNLGPSSKTSFKRSWSSFSLNYGFWIIVSFSTMGIYILFPNFIKDMTNFSFGWLPFFSCLKDTNELIKLFIIYDWNILFKGAILRDLEYLPRLLCASLELLIFLPWYINSYKFLLFATNPKWESFISIH